MRSLTPELGRALRRLPRRSLAAAALATDGDLLVFSQRDEASHDAVVVAINRGSAPAMASFDVPAEWGTASPRDVWTGQPVAVAGGRIEAVVAPRNARIFSMR